MSMALSSDNVSENDAGIDSTRVCEQVSENATNVPLMLDGLRSTIVDLQRQLTEESEKRSALAAIVNSNISEVSDLKKALDAEVKARCVQTERLPSQQLSDEEAAPCQKRASDICFVSLSIKALKDVIDSEKLDRKQADEALLTNISCRLDREKSARQQADSAHLEELNAMFDEHLQNYFKENNEGKESHVRNINLEQKGHVVPACVGRKIKDFMNRGNEMHTSFCKKSTSLRAAVLIALLGMISIVQRRVWAPKSLRLRNLGSTR